MSLLDAIFDYLRPTPSEDSYPIGISDSVMETAIESARSSHPNEFLCFLIGEPAEECSFTDKNEGQIITDFYIIPGTKTNPISAQVQSVNIPVTHKIVGTLHSHPSSSNRPSDEDRNMFRQYPVNIILAHPYTEDSWMAYSSRGEELPWFPMIEEN